MSRTQPGVVETDRLCLRRLSAGDLGWLTALHGDAAVMRYIDGGRPVPAEVVATVLAGVLAEHERLPAGLGSFAAVPRAGGTPLGWLALRPPSSTGIEHEQDAIEVGYRLFPSAWGLGYATEGVRALIRHAFTAVGVPRVVATTMTVNIASRRVLEKAGLRLARTFYAQWPAYLAGAEYGDVVYALNRRDWPG